MDVPAGAIAVGVPPGCVRRRRQRRYRPQRAGYVQNGKRYLDELRRLDG